MKPLLAQLLRHLHEAGTVTGVRLVPIFVATLGSFLLLRLRLETGRRPLLLLLPSELRIGPPWFMVRVSPGPVPVLVLVLPIRTSVSSSFALLLAFAVASSLRLSLAPLAIARASAAWSTILDSLFSLAHKAARGSTHPRSACACNRKHR